MFLFLIFASIICRNVHQDEILLLGIVLFEMEVGQDMLSGDKVWRI